jgi:hypothetical protein
MATSRGDPGGQTLLITASLGRSRLRLHEQRRGTLEDVPLGSDFRDLIAQLLQLGLVWVITTEMRGLDEIERGSQHASNVIVPPAQQPSVPHVERHRGEYGGDHPHPKGVR